jgi:hypothetical protein
MRVAPDDSADGRWVTACFSAETVPAKGEVPWTSAAAWRECWLSLQKTITASRTDLRDALALAARIAHRYELVGDLFAEIADSTCAVCLHPCCLDARVWLDFKDLLLLHLIGHPLPPAQLRQGWQQSCRYLTAHGCALPRMSRPWICTWYICPIQHRVLKRDIPNGPGRLAHWWPEIANLRNRMEMAFVTAALR